MSRAEGVLLFLLACLLGALPAAAMPQPFETTRGPYLQQVSPGGATLRWRTTLNSASVVRYGSLPTNLTGEVIVPGSRVEHEVALAGLAPDTLYYYAVGDETEYVAGPDADHWFRTAPPTGASVPTRVWVVGDSGQCGISAQGCSDAAAVRDAYLAFAAGQPANVWLMLGDNAYDKGRDHEYQAALFDQYPNELRNTPLWPVPGNHEFLGFADSQTQTGVYYDIFTLPAQGEAGGVPSGTEAYYAFDHGDIHFVALDSHDTPRNVGGAMYDWLDADLADTTARWIVVYWHHPPYSKGSHDSDVETELIEMRENFVPLLEKHGVDLQLTGHSHSYERSMLVNGHWGDSTTLLPGHLLDAGDGDPAGDGAYVKPAVVPHSGAVYAVVGSSSKLSTGWPLDHPVMTVGLMELGSLVLDVDADTLDGWFLDDAGAVRDHFRIAKSAGSDCDDGVDNDGDGFVDRTTDLGCTSTADTSEARHIDAFETEGQGGDPADWLDTGAGFSLQEDDLFFVRLLSGDAFFRVGPQNSDAHSHRVGPGDAGLRDVELRGRLRTSHAQGGVGVTVMSGFPDTAAYYRLSRTYGGSYRLDGVGTAALSGQTDTGVVPVPGTWYRFRLQAYSGALRTNLRARVWEDGTPEPANWQADAWDDDVGRRLSGTYGVWTALAGVSDWDDLEVDVLQTAGPLCADGVDNDLDGTIDFDGAGGAPDLACVGQPWRPEGGGCGLGAEVAVLAVLGVRRLRRRRR